MRNNVRVTVCLLAAWMFMATDSSADLKTRALQAAKKATQFLTEQVSNHGGYLWRYSADLKLREGEGIVNSATVWVQPPGTPAVGLAFVELYQATGERQFLGAARAAGEALRLGQMRSGGWQAMIEFEPERRRKWAYRVEPRRKKSKDQSSLDDDKTQSALRFVMRLDQALQFQDEAVHEMAEYALNGLINRGQLANGAFPQVWTSDGPADTTSPERRARFPNSWPRQYPGHGEYWHRPTLNDDLAPDVMRTLLLAERIYDRSDCRTAARKLADFLILSQLPVPQPAWAQQYSFDMEPIWARRFEPPAVTAGESQGVIQTLLHIYLVTGDHKYLEPVPEALAYLKRSELANGRLARFYELQTNRPLYFTREYELTYDGSRVPTHYSFEVSSRLDALRAKYKRLSQFGASQNKKVSSDTKNEPSHAPDSLTRTIREVVNAQDERGAWVTSAGLRYHDQSGRVIEMDRTVDNLRLLADYLAYSR